MMGTGLTLDLQEPIAYLTVEELNLQALYKHIKQQTYL